MRDDEHWALQMSEAISIEYWPAWPVERMSKEGGLPRVVYSDIQKVADDGLGSRQRACRETRLGEPWRSPLLPVS